MPDAHVRYTPRDGKPAKDLALQINGPGANFRIGTEQIASFAMAVPDPFLLDLLDIAGSVFAADRAFSRGGAARPGVGRDWRRKLDFHLAVRCPDLWTRADVTEALQDVVTFLTDDSVSFEFRAGRIEMTMQEYFPLEDFNAKGMGPGEVRSCRGSGGNWRAA